MLGIVPQDLAHAKQKLRTQVRALPLELFALHCPDDCCGAPNTWSPTALCASSHPRKGVGPYVSNVGPLCFSVILAAPLNVSKHTVHQLSRATTDLKLLTYGETVCVCGGGKISYDNMQSGPFKKSNKHTCCSRINSISSSDSCWKFQ